MTASLRSRRTFFIALTLGLPVAAAEACGGGSPPPTLSVNNSAPDTGTLGAPDAGPPDALAADSGTQDGSADVSADTGQTDASDAAPDHADAGPPPPICPLDASVGDAATLVYSTPDPDLMGGISNDNLVVAWTSLPDDGGVYVHWAERASSSAAFGAMQTLDPSLGPVAPDHVALRGDGLQIVFASADRSTLYEVGRSAYGTPFETVDTSVNFQGVNPTSEGGGTSPGLGPFGSPTLASTFTTAWAFVQGPAGFVFSQDELGVWTTPAYPASLTPPASDRYNLTPTGWSSDGRTLFYWDAANVVERAAWRGPYDSLAFATTTAVGALQQYALPSADCTQLYFSAPGAATDLDLFVSSF